MMGQFILYRLKMKTKYVHNLLIIRIFYLKYVYFSYKKIKIIPISILAKNKTKHQTFKGLKGKALPKPDKKVLK